MEILESELSQPITSIPPLQLGEYLVEKFGGNYDHAIVYLETVISSLKDSRNPEKEIQFEAIEDEITSFEIADTASDSILSLNDKFLSDKSNFTLNYGKKDDFMAGLESYIGRPKNPHILECMADEHNKSDNSSTEFRPPNNPQLLTTPLEEWLCVTNPTAYMDQAVTKGRIILDRRMVTIDELLANEMSIKANLTAAEVVAARLYTGPMFKLYNDVLRNPQGSGRQKFVYTIHAFASCIVKLSRVHRLTTLYRGIKGGALPETFLKPDEYGTRGGVEFGFMSTTTAKNVAYDYAYAKDGITRRAAVIYEIEEGAIDRGADVSWLSQFPSENEVVFPPLTNLEVFGKPKIVDGAIVTKLRVNINLRTKTVDEIVDKSRTQFKEMVEWYYDEVKTADLGFVPAEVFPDWLKEFTDFKENMMAEQATRFNQQKFYREAVDDALDLKEGTIQKVRLLNELGKLDPESQTHDQSTFKQTLERLRKTKSSEFADLKFLSRYVRLKKDSFDKDGNNSMENYELLWTLSLQKGSWAQMIRAQSAVRPVKVSTEDTFSQMIRDFAFSVGFGFFKGLWRQLVGFEAVDSLLGFAGVYYYIGPDENGKPFYQLSKKETSLSCKYLYCKDSRWHIGSRLGSEYADVRSATVGDATPSDVRHWEKTTTPLLLAFVFSSNDYVSDSSTSAVLAENDAASQGYCDEENGANPIWNSPSMMLTDRNTRGASTSGRDSAASASRVSRMSKATREQIAATHEGEKWAFVHRIIDEQELLSRSGGSRRLTRNRTIAGDGGQFSKAELHSIAVLCEQTNCPLPKQVSSCLRSESTTAALASALLTFAVGCSIFMVGPSAIWLGIEGLVLGYPNADLAWFMRGQVNSLIVIAYVFWSALLVLLIGCGWKASAGNVCLLICFGVLETMIWFVGSPGLIPVGRAILALGGVFVVYSFMILQVYVFSTR